MNKYMKEFNKGQGNKRKIILFLMVLSLLLYGCAGNEINDEEVTENTVSTEDMAETSEDTQETALDMDDSNPSEGTGEWILEKYAKALTPLMSDKELEDVKWEEDILPYMEYDWLSDEHILRYHIYDSSWEMQLADLNMDGQREMLVSQWFYREDDIISVYSVEEGKVIFCGSILAQYEGEQVENIGFWPSYYIDVYQNEDGTFRYLSCESDNHQNYGVYEIYVSTFDGNQISCKPTYAAMYMYNDTYTEIQWKYLTENYWDDWGVAEIDSEGLTTLNQLMTEYMDGYKKVDVQFIMSEYTVPGCVDELPEEQQEIVRNNILFGFAQALGYVDK